MLRFSGRRCREWGRPRRLGAVLIQAVIAVIGLGTATCLSAQHPAAVASFKHANTVKPILSLDWIGLYDQLALYSAWWKETATCASIPLPARTDSVQFYYVNAPDFLPQPTDKPDRMVAGVTYAANEQIYLSVLRLRDEVAVKHEMLHQLLFWWGENDWDNDARPEFKRCKLDNVK